MSEWERDHTQNQSHYQKYSSQCQSSVEFPLENDLGVRKGAEPYLKVDLRNDIQKQNTKDRNRTQLGKEGNRLTHIEGEVASQDSELNDWLAKRDCVDYFQLGLVGINVEKHLEDVSERVEDLSRQTSET